VTDTSPALVLAIDQGTSSTKVVVLDAPASIVAQATVPLSQSHPQPGWVEQDADALFASVVAGIAQVLAQVSGSIAGIGISSQRESAVAWDRRTGEALGPVLGWQDRRTAPRAHELHDSGVSTEVRELSGLPLDPMFSALKFEWLLDSVDPDRSRSRRGDIALGTVDSWLLFRLTGEHRIEVGNASRTQLLGINSASWEPRLCEIFRVPVEALPEVMDSNAPSAEVRGIPALPAGVRVHAVFGDSHAALYGHGARQPGDVKVTYGTGSSIMGLLAPHAELDDGLVRTIAWNTTGEPALAFEGNILSTGATLVWLADVLGTTPADVVTLAEHAESAGGVTIVPAFSGLGAPWWDDRATALMSGFTLGSTREEIALAAVESIAFQVEDVLAAADASGVRIDRILADGGPSANTWLMQLQANLSQRDVIVSSRAELSAVGAALLAGVGCGQWTDQQALDDRADSPSLHPQLEHESVRRRRATWLRAVDTARGITPQPIATD
jgi:glycerol kinase